jgi:hypothetical protein
MFFYRVEDAELEYASNMYQRVMATPDVISIGVRSIVRASSMKGMSTLKLACSATQNDAGLHQIDQCA